jgi:hypothetical protein
VRAWSLVLVAASPPLNGESAATQTHRVTSGTTS